MGSIVRGVSLLVVLAAGFAMPPSGAEACRAWPKSIWEQLPGFGRCEHALCYRLYRTDPADLTRSEENLSASCGPDFIITGELKGGISEGRIALFGEVHDNFDHHVWRAALLKARASGYSPQRESQENKYRSVVSAVVFEHLRTDQQSAIDAFMTLPKERRTLDAFLDAVDWEKSGWAKYDYRALFQAVLDAGLPIYAGDPPRDLIRKAAKEGAAAIPPDEQKRLGLDVPLSPDLHDASLTEIEESHCGMMPKTAFGGMAFAQRLRDATLADVALKALEKHGAVTVFAGNGHVRTDRGVPWYIRQRAPNTQVPTTMLLEVEDGKTDPEAYVPRGPDLKPAVDTIVFTPRAEREDPCKAFKAKAAPAPPLAANPPPDANAAPVTKN